MPALSNDFFFGISACPADASRDASRERVPPPEPAPEPHPQGYCTPSRAGPLQPASPRRVFASSSPSLTATRLGQLQSLIEQRPLGGIAQAQHSVRIRQSENEQAECKIHAVLLGVDRAAVCERIRGAGGIPFACHLHLGLHGETNWSKPSLPRLVYRGWYIEGGWYIEHDTWAARGASFRPNGGR